MVAEVMKTSCSVTLRPMHGDKPKRVSTTNSILVIDPRDIACSVGRTPIMCVRYQNARRHAVDLQVELGENDFLTTMHHISERSLPRRAESSLSQLRHELLKLV